MITFDRANVKGEYLVIQTHIKTIKTSHYVQSVNGHLKVYQKWPRKVYHPQQKNYDLPSFCFSFPCSNTPQIYRHLRITQKSSDFVLPNRKLSANILKKSDWKKAKWPKI